MSQDLVTLKGTRLGMLVSLIEEGPFEDILAELTRKIEENPGFFSGAPISIHLGWREITGHHLDALVQLIQGRGLVFQGIISSSQQARGLAEARGIKAVIGRLGLAEHGGRMKALGRQSLRDKEKEKDKGRAAAKEEPTHASTLAPQDQGMVVKRSLRSGQKVIFAGHVIVLGDVNPGAELEAGGDVVVIGALRGAVAAGQGGAKGAQVFAWLLQPSRLKIGTVTSGPVFPRKDKGPMVARLVNGDIELAAYTGSLMV